MIKVLIAGDYSPKDKVAKQLEDGNFHYVLGEVKPLVEEAHYAIVNFETTIYDSKAVPIEKCGPNISCGIEAVEALKYAGFDCVTLANNHFADFGSTSVRKTIELLGSTGLDYVGGGNNLEESLKVLYKQVGGGKILAIINLCEEEFTIASKIEGGSAPFDFSYAIPRIVEARGKADYVLMIIHGGKEFYQLPTPRMKRAYRALVDMGVDAVVNHHQHCYSGFEVYKGKPIFYGLGNFCFDFHNKKNESWNEGYLVQLSFDEKMGFEIIPYYQCNGDATIELMNEKQKITLLEKVNELNAIIDDDERLEEEYRKFSETFFRSIRMSLTPYTNQFLYSLCLRHLIPGFITKKRKLILLDYVNCESWRDIFLQYLKSEQK